MEAYLQPWSGMTASHRPIYSPHEIELAIIDRATLMFGSAASSRTRFHFRAHSQPRHSLSLTGRLSVLVLVVPHCQG